MKHDKHQYFSKYVHVVRDGCFLYFLDASFPGMLFKHSLNDLKMVQVAPVITGITFVFTLKIGYICVLSSLYSEIFSVPLLITFYHLKLQ